jgi:hypothetical protein
MKQFFKFSLVLGAGLLLVSSAAFAAGSNDKGASQKTPWKITGQLEEACTCNAPCPCWFNSLPTKMNCGGGQVIFIEKGNYGKVSLDKLTIATFGRSPSGETMMESFGNWDFSYLYVDEKANPEQRKALEEIGRTVFPIAASPNVKVRFAPISRKVEGKEHIITVGEYASIQGHLLEGGLGGTPKIVNPPAADPVHHEYSQGKTTKFAYSDEQKLDAENSNYMFGTFTVDNVQYEKYAAGLAQKMKEMEKENQK